MHLSFKEVVNMSVRQLLLRNYVISFAHQCHVWIHVSWQETLECW